MIKKFAYLFLILFIIFCAAIYLLTLNLPSLCSYGLSRVIGGQATIGGISFSHKGGLFHLILNDIKLKGAVEGTIKRWELSTDITKGLHLREMAVSDFELTMSGSKGKGPSWIPAERLDIRNGTIVYDKEKIIISEVGLSGLKENNPFTFQASLKNNAWFGTLRVSGEGRYKRKLSDAELKGRIEVSGIDLSKLSSWIAGKSSVHGTFAYAKKKLAVNGPFEIDGFQLKGEAFRKPFFVEKGRGNFALTYTGGLIDLRLSDAAFKQTSLTIAIKTTFENMLHLDITSSPLNVMDVKDHIYVGGEGSKASPNILDRLKEGKVRIVKLTIDRKGALNAALELKDVMLTYGKMQFTNIEGVVAVDDKKVSVSQLRGSYKTSTFSGFTGSIPIASNESIRAKGNYSINLRDIPSLLNISGLTFRSGTTDGALEIEGSETAGYKVRGGGELRGAEVNWRKVSMSARGTYKFTNEDITFDPLTLNRGGTDMVIRGRFNRNYLGLQMKGALDVEQVSPLLSMPGKITGIAEIDLELERTGDGRLSVGGKIDLSDLEFLLPGYIRKTKGMKSAADVALIFKDPDLQIERFDFSLDVINLSVSGSVRDKKRINLDVGLDVHGIDRIAGLFFFGDGAAKGDIDFKVAVRDLILPLKKLPYMSGSIKIENGFLRLPWLPKPFTEIQLVSDFAGETFSVEVNKLRCGSSLLNRGVLRVEGLNVPRFFLTLDVERFHLFDFQDGSGFKIPVISKDSIFANTSGDLELTAKEVDIAGYTGQSAVLHAALHDRVISVPELKADALDGTIHVRDGDINLSGPLPSAQAIIRLNEVTSGLFLKSFGAKESSIEGKTTIYAHLQSAGQTLKQLGYGLNGKVAIVSTNGVIKRWNLLSKIFGLLNVYDLFRGRVDLTKDGLPYKKMGATFGVTNGVFLTKDFLIDGSSMVITGDGTLDIRNSKINGNIAVSPLITLDTTIDKIPIIRNILKKKNKGFLYAAYKVHGNLDDPEISVSFVNSIGGKTLEILRNILVLPREVFQ